MPDDYETAQEFDPLNPDDAGQDADGDWETNLEEFVNGTDPRDSASNSSGFDPVAISVLYILNSILLDAQ